VTHIAKDRAVQIMGSVSTVKKDLLKWIEIFD